MFWGLFDRNRIRIIYRGRSRIIYKEGKKKMHVSFEWETPDGAVRIDTYSVRHWEPPFEDELVDTIKKQEILDNIRKDLEKRGATVRFY